LHRDFLSRYLYLLDTAEAMHIKEIIIDGFKSYAQKTVVSGFDPQFNAITGLNGTGKSNILDSICFVLGISNLSQVRVGNLQELVYKQGQAGVTKATVTIIFNNSDSATSPVGYESHKEITVTRQVLSLSTSHIYCSATYALVYCIRWSSVERTNTW
jgi:chromosome segregation ATPase